MDIDRRFQIVEDAVFGRRTSLSLLSCNTFFFLSLSLSLSLIMHIAANFAFCPAWWINLVCVYPINSIRPIAGSSSLRGWSDRTRNPLVARYRSIDRSAVQAAIEKNRGLRLWSRRDSLGRRVHMGFGRGENNLGGSFEDSF